MPIAHQTLSLNIFPNVKHATSAARDAVDEMGEGAHEMVLM